MATYSEMLLHVSTFATATLCVCSFRKKSCGASLTTAAAAAAAVNVATGLCDRRKAAVVSHLLMYNKNLKPQSQWSRGIVVYCAGSSTEISLAAVGERVAGSHT